MILREYLERISLKIFFSSLIILLAIIFGNQMFLVLRESIILGFSESEVVRLFSLKMLRDLHLVLSICLIVSISLTLNKLFKNSEAIIIINGGIGIRQFFQFFNRLIIFVTITVGSLSLFISPYLQNEIQILQKEAEKRPLYVNLKQETFQRFLNNKITFYSSKVSKSDSTFSQKLEDVFISDKSKNENEKIILAKKGIKFQDKYGKVYLNLFDGKIYKNLIDQNLVKEISTFKNLTFVIFENEEINDVTTNEDYRTLSFANLFSLNTKESLSEIMFRISQPIFIFLMSLITILISKTSTRNVKNLAIVSTLSLYALYYTLIITFKSLIESGNINIFSGILLPHMIVILILIFTLKSSTLSK